MALREIISNLALQLDCDIADQKRYCVKKLEGGKGENSQFTRSLAILNRGETTKTTFSSDETRNGRKNTCMKFPSFSWAVSSTSSSTKRFSPVRFDLLLLRVLRGWKRIVQREKANTKIRDLATKLSCLETMKIHRERRLFIKLCKDREYELYENAATVIDGRIMNRQRGTLRSWIHVLRSTRFRRFRVKCLVFNRWRRKHEAFRRVNNFTEFLSARRQLSALRKWVYVYRERQVAVKFNLPLLSVFRKWREETLSCRARSRLVEFATRLRSVCDETFQKWRSKMFRVWRRKYAKMTIARLEIQTLVSKRTCRDFLRSFKNLFIAKSYSRKRCLQSHFKLWINTKNQLLRCVIISDQIRNKRISRVLQMWRRSRVFKTREKAGTEMAVLYRRQKQIRNSMLKWKYYCKSRLLNRRYQNFTLRITRNRVRDVWLRWRTQYFKRLYAAAAYVLYITFLSAFPVSHTKRPLTCAQQVCQDSRQEET